MVINKIQQQIKLSINDSVKSQKGELYTNRFVRALLIIWTAIILLSLVWNISTVKQHTLEDAIIQARIAYQKDTYYRQWNSEHGGVYVPVTEETLPNPFLSNYPKRDLETTSGLLLTLINPAYMTRQVHEIEEETGIYGHITSLNPIRPQNAPDLWEIEALKTFENGEGEVTSLEEINGKEYLRLMQPLIVIEDCLKCHIGQGLEVGDIHGGISASVLMEPLWENENKSIYNLALSHFILLLVGFSIILVGGKQLSTMVGDLNISKKKEVERSKALQKSEEKIRAIVQDQTEFLVRYRPDTTLTFVNKSYCRNVGKSTEELIGSKFFDNFSKTDQEKLKMRIDSLSPKNPFVTVELSQGKERWEVWTDRGIFNEDGKLVEVQSVGRDVTDRKKAEIGLKKSKNAALNLMQDATLQSELAKEALIKLEISQKDLEERAKELEMFNKRMVEREMRIIEMKEEVNQLRKELGQEPPYPEIW